MQGLSPAQLFLTTRRQLRLLQNQVAWHLPADPGTAVFRQEAADGWSQAGPHRKLSPSPKLKGGGGWGEVGPVSKTLSVVRGISADAESIQPTFFTEYSESGQ
jgi:hypothetical protein